MLQKVSECRDVLINWSFERRLQKVKKQVNQFWQETSKIIFCKEKFVNLPCYYMDIKIDWEKMDNTHIQVTFSDYLKRIKKREKEIYNLGNKELINQQNIYCAGENREDHDKNVLICVPHCDDEFFLSGGVIKKKINEGAKVSVVFCFNNDKNGEKAFEVRHENALNALRLLGVSQKNIYCLGYSNGHFMKDKENLYFARNGKVIVNNSGINSTYGTKWIKDFHSLYYGQRAPFSHENIRDDLGVLIKLLMPNEIYAIDLDDHIDHIVCSLVLEEAIGDVIKSIENFYPKVYKGFAYGMSAYGCKDLYKGIHLKPTKRTWRYFYNMYKRGYGLDNPRYCWNARVRVENPPECQTRAIKENILVRAYLKYGLMYSSISSFINRDTVFWERKTNNIALKAETTVSSGNGYYLNDFKLLDISDIEKKTFSKDCWHPDIIDDKKCIYFSWMEVKTISDIIIYQNLNFIHGIKKIKIKMDGYEKQFRLRGNRCGDIIKLGRPVRTEWIEISIILSAGEYGIDEIEVYEYMGKIKKSRIKETMLFP